jgi:predicted nuclease with TOPRIM domain
MKEKFDSKYLENEELTKNIEDSDYQNLITRLKDISSTIALLEKKIFR